MSRRRAAGIAMALLAFGLLAEWGALQRAPLQEPVGSLDLRRAAADLATGWGLAACGLIAWSRHPGNRTGPLLTATAATWFLGTFADSGLAGLADIGSLFVALHRGPLFHAVLAYPDGRVPGRLARAVVAAGYVTAAIAAVGNDSGVTIAIVLLVLAVVARRFAQAPARRRLALRPSLGSAVALAAILTTGAILDLRGASAATDRAVLFGYEAVVIGSAAWFVVDLVRGRWTQSTVTGLVVELGGGGNTSLRDRLAHALGDPSLVVGYRVADSETYVDAEGRALQLPVAPSSREITYLGDGEPVALLIHERGAVDDPALLDAVAAAARIAVSNVQLQSEVRDRLEELARSRRRIVEAADAQRRRLERQLRTGAQWRLGTLADMLRRAAGPRAATTFESMRADVLLELSSTQSELDEFARGVRPPILTDGGLDAALADLARRTAVPLDLSCCGKRFEPAVEAAAYFVCAEALANIGKYAHASHAAIRASHEHQRLVVEIADDGVGGADLSKGSGLRGLRDRVEALGGTLVVDSPAGDGTRILAVLPQA